MHQNSAVILNKPRVYGMIRPLTRVLAVALCLLTLSGSVRPSQLELVK